MANHNEHPGLTIFEKIETTIYPDAREASERVASEIANLIRARNQIGQNTVLGLATGSTPIRVYNELGKAAPGRRVELPARHYI